MVRAKVRTCAATARCSATAWATRSPPDRALAGPPQLERYLERLYHAVKEEARVGSHVRETTHHGIPPASVPRSRLFQCLPGSKSRFESYLAVCRHRRQPALMMRSSASTASATARMSSAIARFPGSRGLRGDALARSYSRGPTSGTGTAVSWRIGLGLPVADRSPKPALAAVREAFAQLPFRGTAAGPRISRAVCTYNGARTIRDCLDALESSTIRITR